MNKVITSVVFVVIFFSYRKKFGWLTFAVNLLSYFAFLIPLTSLAVYGRTNEDTLCKIDNSTDSGYEVYIPHYFYRQSP